MAESTILAAGTTATASSPVTVPAGGSVVLSLFVAAGVAPPEAEMDVRLILSGAEPAKIDTLTPAKALVVDNPTGTDIQVDVLRKATTGGKAVGVKAIT